ncbi:MAG: pilus assembly protein PilP [Desulfuromonadales bacterium]
MAAACIAMFSACKKADAPPAPAPTPAVKEAPKPVQKAVSSVARVAAPPANQFDFSKKKDPFKPYIQPKLNVKSTPDALKKAQQDALPILSFDVNQFKLIGVITGGKQNQAMVTDPAGKGYVLKIGMTIGNKSGKVTAITTTGVDITEKYTDDNGKASSQVTQLVLPRKQ